MLLREYEGVCEDVAGKVEGVCKISGGAMV